MENDQFLNCPICLEIAKDAVESDCCHNIFCQECAESFSARECPVCRTSTFKFHNSILARRMVSTMPYVCPDCQDKTTLGDYSNHMELCSKKTRFCAIGNCSFKGDSGEFFKHLKENHQKEVYKAFEKDSKKKNEDVEKTKMATSKSFNDSIKDLITDVINVKKNAAGRNCRLGEQGKYYCRVKQDNPCSCCDGYCGPTNGCNCRECMDLDIKSRGLPKGHFVNSDGAICRQGTTGQFYCGRYKRLPMSDGYCGPTNGPSCAACKKIGEQVKGRYQGLN